MEGMFLTNVGRGRNTQEGGCPRAPREGRIQGPHLFPPCQRVLKGQGAVHCDGLWGLPNSLQAGAGGAAVSKRPREPVFLGLLCSLPGPPFRAPFCGVVPLYARGSSVSVTSSRVYTSHLPPRAGTERGSWKGSRFVWETDPRSTAGLAQPSWGVSSPCLVYGLSRDGEGRC